MTQIVHPSISIDRLAIHRVRKSYQPCTFGHTDLEPMPPLSSSTGVAITNPLVLYRALLATKRIDPDPAQHRLAIHLQKLYESLKDYEPIVQYSHRLQQIGRAIGSSPGQNITNGGAEAAGLASRTPGVLSGLFENRQAKDGLALTRVLTNHESAMQMDSPRGLMLHGEVGTGMVVSRYNNTQHTHGMSRKEYACRPLCRLSAK